MTNILGNILITVLIDAAGPDVCLGRPCMTLAIENALILMHAPYLH